MLKKFLTLITSVGIIFSPLQGTGEALAFSTLPITAPSAILIDHASQRIIYAKTPHLKRAPASTTKILTAIVVLEHLPLGRVVTIPAFVENIQPSKAYLKAGEQYRVRDLLRAVLINSSNDAAETLAFVAGRGSPSRFTQLMNHKAKSLGCFRSHFVNSSGLPAKNQYSTAYDMALIMKEAHRYPFLVKTLGTRTTVIQSLGGRKITLKNHNKMLWQKGRDVVGKTGWTRKAKYCFVGQIQSKGRQIFVSMLGSHRLWRDLKTLADYQFGLSLFKRYQNHKTVPDKQERVAIQMALRRAGFDPSKIDGVFGPSTIRAVKKFQKANGLQADGIVGPKTRQKLKRFIQ